MTINTGQNKSYFLGNGATTVFTYPFVMGDPDWALVYYVDASGNVTTLDPSLYTVTMNPVTTGNVWGVGGTLTYPLSGSPIATGTQLVLLREVPLEQLSVFANQGAFNGTTVEQTFDYGAMTVDDLGEILARAIIGNPTDASTVSYLLPAAALRANKMLGFDASGSVTVLSVGSGGGVGGVGLAMPADFNVANSPTSSGTLTVTYANQSANVIFAGPASGVPAAPTFRAMTAADLPGGIGLGTITAVVAGTGLTGGTTSGSATLALATGAAVANLGFTPLNRASNLSDLASTVSARTNLGVPGLSGSFTVGHVAVFNTTGGAIADGGAVGTGTITSVTATSPLAGGGSSGAVTVSLSGTVAVAQGGTGNASLTAHGVLVGNGTSAVSVTGTGAVGQILTSNGPGSDPTFQPLTAGGGTVTQVNTGSGVTGGPITGTGTISLSTVTNNNLLANITGATNSPSGTTISAFLDSALGSTQGSIVYRGAATWAVLTPGTTGTFLQTQGGGFNPQWAAGAAGTVTSITAGTGLTGGTISSSGTIALTTPVIVANGGSGTTSMTAHGVVIGAGTSSVAVTTAGTSGQVLTSNGASSDPTFQASPYIVSFGASLGTASPGVLANSQILGYHIFDIAVTFPANFASPATQATAAANATAATTLLIQKRSASPNTWGTAIGSVVYGAGGVTTTSITTTGGTSVTTAAGDVWRLVGPSSADATFGDPIIALYGQR